jgi:dolichol-phosphate mannosyltransferase
VESLLLLICTYNERGNLPSLFEQIESVIPNAKILVVDDNSPDGTSDWVVAYQEVHPCVSLIRRTSKLGLGTAIREGMQFAIEHGYDWVLNMDADLSHSPLAILQLLQQTDDNDVVIGSRYVPGGAMEGCSWRRVFVSKCANAYARSRIGWAVRDCSSAFRLYRVALLKKISLNDLQGTGYGFLEEVLWHLLSIGSRWTEVGIVYTERRTGKSKISLREAWSTIKSIHHVARLKQHRSPE